MDSLPHLVAENGGGVDDWTTEVEVGVEGHQDGGAGELRLQPAVLAAGVRAVGGVQGKAQAVHQFVLQTEGGADHVLGAPFSGQLGSRPWAPFGLQLQVTSNPAGVDVGLTS